MKSATGFLLKAIKQNYANPEFVSEDKKQIVKEEKKAKQVREHNQQLLEDQRTELETSRDKEWHQLCERMVQETPTLLEKVVADVCKENPLLKKACQLGKSLLEAYQEKPMLRVMVDQQLMNFYPERFRALRKRYESQIAALG